MATTRPSVQVLPANFTSADLERLEATWLVGVRSEYGNDIAFYDDAYGPLWAYRDDGGLRGLVRAQTWESAYECVLDEILKPIPEDEVEEAYNTEDQGDAEYPELHEGYQYQPNATGTGIVAIDLNGESLDELTPELLAQLQWTIEFSEEDADV